MIIPVKIDAWTRRNFHHAPVSMNFVNLKNSFRRVASDRHNAARYGLVARRQLTVPDIRPHIEFRLFEDQYSMIIYANLRRVVLTPSQGVHIFEKPAVVCDKIREFNETLGMQLHSGTNIEIEMVKREMVEEMQDKFAKFYSWVDPRPIIQRYNRENWRNMA